MHIIDWLSNNYLEIFGAVTGIIYVFLEIKQNMWLWPVGIVTSAVYIWVFFHGKLYADMSLQVYYLAVSILGWYWWIRGAGLRAQGTEEHPLQGAGGFPGYEAQGTEEHPLQGAGGFPEQGAHSTDSPLEGGRGDVVIDKPPSKLVVHRLSTKSGIALIIAFVILYFVIWFILSRFTDSPVPAFDSFITSLSIVATWMLARKIFEHWYLWIIVNAAAAILFFTRALYPTVILYVVYCIMSFAGLFEWKKSLTKN